MSTAFDAAKIQIALTKAFHFGIAVVIPVLVLPVAWWQVRLARWAKLFKFNSR